MTVKERIIRQAIAAAEKELAEIEYLINTPFLSLIIEHRQKVFGMPREELTGKVLDAAIQHEKKLFALAERANSEMLALGDRRVELSSELGQLNRELYFETKAYKSEAA